MAIHCAYTVSTAVLHFLTLFSSSTSPSIYVAFTSIAAGYSNDQPPDFMSTTGGCPMTVGSQYFNVTRAYPPNYLMTIPRSCNYHMNQQGRQWGTLRVEDLINPPQNWIAEQGCAGQGAAPLREDLSPNGTDMAARPLLSYPGDILTLDPAWPSNCCSMDMWNWGFNDPPRTLDPVAMMAPTAAGVLPSSDAHSPSPNPQPTPEGRITPSIASSTIVPSHTRRITTVTPTSAIHVAPTAADPTSLLQTAVGDPQAHALELKPVIITTIGADPMYQMPNGDVSIAGQIISLDRPAVTVDNTRISVDHQKVHVGDTVYSANAPITSSPAPSIAADPSAPFPGSESHVLATVGNDPVHAMPHGDVSIAGQIVAVGGPVVTVHNTAISVDSQAVHVDDTTHRKHQPMASFSPAPNLIAGQTLRFGLSGAVVLGDKTIHVGQQQTVRDTHLSVGLDHMVVGSKTYAVPSTTRSGEELRPPVDSLPSIGAQSIGLNSEGAVVVGDLTIPPGQHKVIGSNTILANSDHPVINGHTYSVPYVSSVVPAQPTRASRPQIVGGQVLQAGDGGAILLGDSSILPGQYTDIQGTYVSVGANSMVIGSNIYDKPSTEPTVVANPTLASSALQVLAGSAAVSIAQNGAIILGGSTILPGQHTMIHGTYVSVNNEGVIIGSSTYGASGAGSTARNPAASALPAAIGTLPISVASNGAIVESGSTLSPGSHMTISGHRISVDSDMIVIGSSCYALPDYPTIFTASNSDFIIDHQTLTIGESTTISGRLLQVESSIIIIGGTTYPIPTQTGILDGPLTTIDPLGQVIASMFGYRPSTSSSSSSTSDGNATATSCVSSQNAPSSKPTLSSFTSAQSRLAVDRGTLLSAFVLCTYLGALLIVS